MRAVLVCCALLVCPLSGCSSPDDGPSDPPAAASEDERTLSGTLEYRELPATKSLEAYMGVEFVLTDAEGTEHVLAPSDAVSHEALVAQDGKSVVVTGRWAEPTQPDPQSSYPTGPDGEPLERPGRYHVLKLSPDGS